MPKPRIMLHNQSLGDHGGALATHLQDLWDNYVLRYQYSSTPAAAVMEDPERVSGDDEVGDNLHESTEEKSQLLPSIVMLNLIDKCDSQGNIGRFMVRVLNCFSTTADADSASGDVDDDYAAEVFLSDRNEVTVSNYLLKLNTTSNFPATPFGNALMKRLVGSYAPTWLRLRHVWYDFHHHHQGGSPSGKPLGHTRNILMKLRDVLLSNQSFFLSSHHFSTPVQGYQQSQIIRTNCVDSLDRTNVAQV
jgi:hypothetical protein